MLITLSEILKLAEAKQCAVGSFNTASFEGLYAVLSAAEKLNTPVIVAHAQRHESVSPLRRIGPVMIRAAKAASVPVCVHLDHCEDMTYMEQALEMGFTGVMYDGSALPYAQNLANTRKAVALAGRYGAGVEAELGALASGEGGTPAAGGPVYTNPEEAADFCARTGIDALAPSFGTSHGIYKQKPVLDLELVREIAERVKLPLVMHGGSGVSADEYRRGIRSGLRKINYFTYMSRAGTDAVRALLQARKVLFFHDVALAAEQGMEADAERAMRLFAGL